jgi:ribokinase
MIFVLASFMMDLVSHTERFPNPGETVIGNKFNTHLGGKGINQAVQARRLGAKVHVSGAVGNDFFGDLFVKMLAEEKIPNNDMYRKDVTGVGSISIDKTAQNKIIIVPGANLEYDLNDLNKVLPNIIKADVLLAQLEMSLDVVTVFAKIAKANNKTFILNPAPAKELADELLSCVNYLTPNETELEILTKCKITNLEDIENACKILLNKGVGNVIVTLGDEGALFINHDKTIFSPAKKVIAVDTVAAGDSFNGALAYGLDKKMKIQDILKLANACGALTVTREGAIPSLPTLDEVKTFINNNS